MLAKLAVAALVAFAMLSGARAGFSGDKYMVPEKNYTMPTYNYTLKPLPTYNYTVPPLPKISYTKPTYTKPMPVFVPNITYEVPKYNYTKTEYSYNATAVEEMYMSKLEEFKTQYAEWSKMYG